MAYFGDTLAHSALLGIALGTLFQANLNLSIALVCVALAVILMLLSRQQSLASDTMLGILSHSSLAIGLVVLGLMQDFRIDLTGYLRRPSGHQPPGSALDRHWRAVDPGHAGFLWRGLLMITIHDELAAVEGHSTGWLRLALMLMLSLVIATAMKNRRRPAHHCPADHPCSRRQTGFRNPGTHGSHCLADRDAGGHPGPYPLMVPGYPRRPLGGRSRVRLFLILWLARARNVS